MRSLRILLGVLCVLSFGCGSRGNVSDNFKVETKMAEDAAGNQPAAAAAPEEAPAAAPTLPRKIIYTAQVDLNVSDFDQGAEELEQIAKEYKGYIAKSYISGSPGSQRSGSWTIRVPVENFDAFMAAVQKLGELRSSKTDSEDITDKFYDLKAHIKTNKVEEEALQKLLVEKAPNSKLEDLIAVRRELRNIRAEIEQQEGRLNRWDKESALSTITVTLNDRHIYIPENAPAFGTTIGRTFNRSLEAIVDLGKFLILAIVALAPWLVLLAIPVVSAILLIRRLRRLSRPTPTKLPPSGDAPTLTPA